MSGQSFWINPGDDRTYANSNNGEKHYYLEQSLNKVVPCDFPSLQCDFPCLSDSPFSKTILHKVAILQIYKSVFILRALFCLSDPLTLSYRSMTTHHWEVSKCPSFHEDSGHILSSAGPSLSHPYANLFTSYNCSGSSKTSGCFQKLGGYL